MIEKLKSCKKFLKIISKPLFCSLKSGFNLQKVSVGLVELLPLLLKIAAGVLMK
jgi:hypothetical protein